MPLLIVGELFFMFRPYKLENKATNNYTSRVSCVNIRLKNGHDLASCVRGLMFRSVIEKWRCGRFIVFPFKLFNQAMYWNH